MRRRLILRAHRVKMMVGYVGKFLGILVQCATIYLFEHGICPPAATLHDIGVGHTEGMHNGRGVVPEVVKAEVRAPNALEQTFESLGDGVRVRAH